MWYDGGAGFLERPAPRSIHPDLPWAPIMLPMRLTALLLLLVPAAAAAHPAGRPPTARCVTPAVRDARLGTAGPEATLSAASRSEVPLLTRPPAAFHLDTTHFKVHYDEVSLAGYADTLGLYLELGWRGLVDTLGYQVPPSDGSAGGDSRIDVYVVPAGSIPLGGIGVTVPEDSVPATPAINDFTCHVQVVDSLGPSLLAATGVHEFFHVLHFGYDAQESAWFLEMISTWAEERLVDWANAYHRYLDDFFGRPEISLTSNAYANVIWALYQTEVFDDGVLRETLEECVQPWGANALAATDTALAGRGSSRAEAFSDFAVWNLFTAERDDGLHYPEGGLYPPVRLEVAQACPPIAHPSDRPLALLSTGYVSLDAPGSAGELQVDFLGQWTATWRARVVRFFTSGGYDVQEIPLSGGSGSIQVTGGSDLADLFVVACCVGVQGGGSQDFLVTLARPPGDPPGGPYILVLDRDGCLLPFDGSGDDFGPGIGTEGPWHAAFDSLPAPYLFGDRLPDDLSDCSAVFLLGGYGPGGVNLSDAELDTLMRFMDDGGDVYLEARRPSAFFTAGAPSTASEFFDYFGAGGLPGLPDSLGNVSSLGFPPGGAIPETLTFAYDYRDAPDDSLERLQPGPEADTLLVDQDGFVRMTGRVSGARTTVLASFLLGGISDGPGGARDELLWEILRYMANPVGVVSVPLFEATGAEGGISVRWTVRGAGEGRFRLGGRDLGRDDGIGEEDYAWIHRGNLDGRPVYAFLDRVDPGPGGRAYVLEIDPPGEPPRRFGPVLYSPPRAGDLDLLPVRPNPFNPRAEIRFDLHVRSPVTVRVYDARGLLVEERSLGVLPPGRHVLHWPGPGRSPSSGVYLLVVETPEESAVAKLVLLR
jgi:hypothetical protein